MALTIAEHLKKNTEYGPDCWLWTGTITADGYGRFKSQGKNYTASRISAQLFLRGGFPIPEGLQVNHLCRVRHCVRPSHLEIVTQQENIDRGIVGEVARAMNLAKTHCPQDHPYSGDNLMYSEGKRRCRTCRRSQGLKSKWRQR